MLQPRPTQPHAILDKHDLRSWGGDWGENGYIFLAYGSDMCSITYLPTYVDTEIADP